MLRIYLTNDGIEGYHEGCFCCSSTENASIKDIDTLIESLYSQINDLTDLKFLTKTYGEDNLVSWKRQSDKIRHFKDALEAAEKYSADPTIQGNYYKQSFDNKNEIIRELSEAENIFSKVPTRFKEYLDNK